MTAPRRRPRRATPLKNPARRPTCWVWRTTADSVPSGATKDHRGHRARDARTGAQRRGDRRPAGAAHGVARRRRVRGRGRRGLGRPRRRGREPGAHRLAHADLRPPRPGRVRGRRGLHPARPARARPRCSCCCRPGRSRSRSAWHTSPPSSRRPPRTDRPRAAALRDGRLVVLPRAGARRRATGLPDEPARLRRARRGAVAAQFALDFAVSAAAPASAPASCARCWYPSRGSGSSTCCSSPSASRRRRRRDGAGRGRGRAPAGGAARRLRARAHGPDRQRRGAPAHRAGGRRPPAVDPPERVRPDRHRRARTAPWPRSPARWRPSSGPTGRRRRASRCSTTCTPTTSPASTPSWRT